MNRPALLAPFLLALSGTTTLARADAPDELVLHPTCTADDGGGALAPLITPHFRSACDLISAANGYFGDPSSLHDTFEWWFGPWDWTDGKLPPGQTRLWVKDHFAQMGVACKGWVFEARCFDEKNYCFFPDTGKPRANLYSNQAVVKEPLPIWVCGDAYRKLADDLWMLDSKASNWGHELSHPCRNDTKNDP